MFSVASLFSATIIFCSFGIGALYSHLLIAPVIMPDIFYGKIRFRQSIFFLGRILLFAATVKLLLQVSSLVLILGLIGFYSGFMAYSLKHYSKIQ
jgi:hypothetical protein